MSQENIRGKCPKCGKMLEIPQDLEHFSCLYCGARLTIDQLCFDRPEGDFDQCVAFYHSNLQPLMGNCLENLKSFTRKKYENAFEDFKNNVSAPLTQLDLACRIRPLEREKVLQAAVKAYLDYVHSAMEADHRWNRKGSRERMMYEYKLTIVLYLVPSVKRLDLTIGEDFVDILHSQWMERHPDSPYENASFSQINEGFRKSRLCFITTAVCAAEGKPDDCAELTAFRTFRDGYLSQCPDGEALIARYYEIAPQIVTCINLCDNPTAIYPQIRTTYLQPCYDALQKNDLPKCKQIYTKMVLDLEQKYLS